jgi:serine phosphatase RsbU (regulator of sigma subunit)
MKERLQNRIIIPLLIILFIIPFVYDLNRFFTDLDNLIYDYIAEALNILFALLYYFYLVNKVKFQDKNIQENLKFFVYLLGILYLVVIVAQIILSPSYSSFDTPPLPETFTSVIYATLISTVAILVMVPLVIILNNLIYYKRTRRTFVFMRGLVLFSLAAMISGIITRSPLSFDFDPSSMSIYNDIFVSIVLSLIVILSLRNSWITFLSRKEKVTYFFISLFIFWAVLYLYNFAFKLAVPAHSIAVGVFVNIVWYFNITYILFACLYLLFQLPTARIFDRKMDEVASLRNLNRVISSEFDFEKLVKLLTEMAIRVIGAESIWLELYKPGTDQLYIASSQNLRDEELSGFGKYGRLDLSGQVLKSRKPILINEISKNHPYAYIRDWKPDIGSIIGAPLLSGDSQTLGFLFATKKHSYGFYPDDLDMLESYALQAVIALENVRHLKESIERERMEEELRIARNVQQRLLPDKTPQCDGIAIETLTITAYEVGGDYYDFLNLPDQQLGLIIGDVSGKGTSAAFYMAEAKGIIQSLSKSFHQPRELLIRTNEILYETLERKSFISMMMACLNPKTKTLSFARAGHCPLLYYNASKKTTQLLQPGGIGVGLEKGTIFRDILVEEKVKYATGDIFVFYTDGLSEARNHEGQEYGEERLIKIIADNADKTAAELKDMVINSILSFLDGTSLSDDLTMLLLKLQN